jgi:mannosyl-3-phosphoglycerate phosphatase family protein
LGLNYPFIVEDGGATFIGRDYFRTRYLYQRVVDGYNVVEYGMPYQHIRRILKTIVRETGLELKMYGDMSVDEIVDRTGLSLGAAERARGRQYQETIVSPLSAEDFRRLTEALSRRGLRLSAGTRYYGVMGTNDKGRAAADLIELYHQEYGNILTVGIGDGRNDAPLFAAVDRPVLVQKPGAIWEDIDHPKLVRIEGAGPVGWNRVIIQMLS